MGDMVDFGRVILFASSALLLAIGVRMVAGRLAVPTAGLLLVAAAAASDMVDRLDGVLTIEDVQRIVTLALVVILFEGGSNIGVRRFRASAAPIVALGVLGTFGTAALVAVAAHYALGFSWTVAGLIGAALSPTDPAVTFSVLAGRQSLIRIGSTIFSHGCCFAPPNPLRAAPTKILPPPQRQSGRRTIGIGIPTLHRMHTPAVTNTKASDI